MSDTQNPNPAQGQLARNAAVIGAGMAAALLVSGRANALSLTYAGSIPGTGDVKVLNYALALEEFEAALYQAALARLTAFGVAAGNKAFDLLTEFSVVEQDHATFLRSALAQTSGPVISQFTYDFSAVTNAASARSVLELVLQVEATGDGRSWCDSPSLDGQQVSANRRRHSGNAGPPYQRTDHCAQPTLRNHNGHRAHQPRQQQIGNVHQQRVQV